MLTPGRDAMLTGTLQTWITRQIAVRQRLERVCTSSLLFLMVVTTKHSLQEAARFSGLHPSLFSKMLHSHAKVATTTLESLSKTPARQFATTLERVTGLPWKIVIIIDATLQHRASLHPENAKTFNHGKEHVIAYKGWNFLIALSKTRRVKSEALALTTPQSRQWCHIDTFFRRHRRLKWSTMRLATSGNKRQRMDVRVRHTSGSLRSVGKVELVCSEMRNRPDGRRKYLACNDLRATARQIVTGYRMRWAVELFHKSVKQHLGFEEVATHGFDAVMAHVHWVYCAYILLHMSPPGLSPGVHSIGDKQRALQQSLADKEKRQILQKLTQIGGVQRYKDELRQALVGT